MKMPQQVVHMQPGAVRMVAEILREQPARRLLFVADEVAYRSAGVSAILEPLLASRETVRFTGFSPNPKVEDVQRGVKLCNGLPPELTIAIGGGTAIDLAKLIGAATVHGAAANEIITGDVPLDRNGPPLVAIPTTAGTGSEATHFAVAYVQQKKYSVASPGLLPAFAIVDSQLTHSMPPGVTAASGLDTLCQSIESIWSVGATNASIEDATRALRLSRAHLEAAVLAPTAADRQGMCEAAFLAGRAINITKTTAPHAISYAFTTHYGVPHGMAVALTLAPILQHNAGVTEVDCNDARGPTDVRSRIALILRLLGGNMEHGLSTLEALIDTVGGVLRLSDLGAESDEAIRFLAGEVNAERLANNPRKLDAARIEKILRSIRWRALRRACTRVERGRSLTGHELVVA